jgi:hypothetical protein
MTAYQNDSAHATLTTVMKEVRTASETRAAKFGGGSLFAAPVRQLQEVDRDLADWHRS